MENNAGNIDNSHAATDMVTVKQATKNIPQFQQQATMDGHLNGAPAGYNFCHYSLDNMESSIPECIPSDQHYSTTVFNIDGVVNQSQQ
jgi:hypothetical protein